MGQTSFRCSTVDRWHAAVLLSLTDWALLAPGPSARELVPKIPKSCLLGVIGNAFELVDRAEFLVSADRGWWMQHPEAMRFPAKLLCNFPDIVDVPSMKAAPDLNSGLLGLMQAVLEGATTIRLYGFDMHGSHFFGQYNNGLRNTTELRREAFIKQYNHWAATHKSIKVLNCTPGSALQCFPFEV